jgi:hypothetical protein
MTAPLQLEQSRAFPVSLDRAWQVVLPAPLEQIFSRRYGALPPVTGVRDQDGDWGRVGQTRTIRLADGGSMREELTVVTPGQEFGYTITEVTGPMKALVASAEGRWVFTEVGTGVRVSWSWTVHPLNSFAELAMPLFGWLWRGYARRALEQVETLLLAP